MPVSLTYNDLMNCWSKVTYNLHACWSEIKLELTCDSTPIKIKLKLTLIEQSGNGVKKSGGFFKTRDPLKI